MPQGQYKLSDIEQPKGQYSVADIAKPDANDSQAAPAQAQTFKVPDEPPGIATRFMQGLLDNTVGTHTNEGVIEGFTKGLPFLAKHPIESAKLIGGAMLGGHQQAAGEAVNQMQQPGAANKVVGGVRYLQSGIPIVGPMLDQAGKKFQEGDIAGGLGSTAGIAALTHGGNPEVRANAAEVVKAPVEAATKFAKAESNPNKLYGSYLGPVADNPHPVPNAPAPVLKAVLRDMEAAGDGDAAARIKSGNATIRDLDTARQSANRLAKSIYRSPGNYSPGMATGADAFASSIRDSIYPEIEKAHNMEPGSLRGVKQLQGKQMASERNPGLVDKIVTQGIGAGSGAALGHATGIPGAEYIGAAAGGRLAEPVAAGIKKGAIGLRTKRLAMNLPDPKAPASKLPFLDQQPSASPIEQPTSPPTNSPTNLIDILRDREASKQLPDKGGVIAEPTRPLMFLPAPKPEVNLANTPALPIDESVPSFLRGKSNGAKSPYLQEGQSVPAHLNKQQLVAIDKAGLAVGENGKLVKKSVVEENALFNILRGTANGRR